MLEHIPSNPKHSVIRGGLASHHCDRTSTCDWSAKTMQRCVGVGGGEKLEERGSRGY